MSNSDDLEELRRRLISAEKRSEDAERSCEQAARYGQDLLAKLKDSESRIEALTQEKHELGLRYAAKLASHGNYEDEFEGLRHQLKVLKEKSDRSKSRSFGKLS